MCELNYHAGAAIHHQGEFTSLKAKHTGVQFSEESEELLLAGLLYHACCYPNVDLSVVRFSEHELRVDVKLFMENEASIRFKREPGPFCKSKEEDVMLYCICHKPWIEGSTSKAIYGTNQKQFNCHRCCRCNNWFHKYCLAVCGIRFPKRTDDFLCPDCSLPATIPWRHPFYVNTCTSDNFLTIMLLYCRQNQDFLNKLNLSPAECALKAGITSMLHGNIIKGKTTVLDYVSSVLNYNQVENKLNCFGSEFGMFLQAFCHIWKIQLDLKCDSPSCPVKFFQRYQTTYTLQSLSVVPFDLQLKKHFPKTGDRLSGYCGSEFKQTPPSCAPVVQNVRENIETHEKISFYECRGTPIVKDSFFLTKSPWMIPFEIGDIKEDELYDTLPLNITVFGNTYQLAGFTLHQGNHFTCVLFWNGKRYYYDGLKDTEKLRLILFAKDRLKGFQGSNAYYFVT